MANRPAGVYQLEMETTALIRSSIAAARMAIEADVLVVAIRASEQDGVRLADVVWLLAQAAAEHGSRLGFVGGAGSLHVTEGGPRLVDLPTFPEAHKGEALGQADVLAALRETRPDADWFYLSPAASFGSSNPAKARPRATM